MMRRDIGRDVFGSGRMSVDHILGLQRTIGNRAVTAMLATTALRDGHARSSNGDPVEDGPWPSEPTAQEDIAGKSFEAPESLAEELASSPYCALAGLEKRRDVPMSVQSGDGACSRSPAFGDRDGGRRLRLTPASQEGLPKKNVTRRVQEHACVLKRICRWILPVVLIAAAALAPEPRSKIVLLVLCVGIAGGSRLDFRRRRRPRPGTSGH